jgi:hypothetical protein
MRWTLGFVLLVVLSVIVLAMPARFEGPILLTSVALGAVPAISRPDRPAGEEPPGSPRSRIGR